MTITIRRALTMGLLVALLTAVLPLGASAQARSTQPATASAAAGSPYVPVPCVKTPTHPVGPGSTGPTVKYLQCLLQDMNMYSIGAPLTGKFDARTAVAVKRYKFYKFQRTTDAIVGPTTWFNIIVTAYTRLPGHYAYLPGLYPPYCPDTLHYPLTRGDRGPAVRLLQCMINTQYYQAGSRKRVIVDGVFGSATAAAVKDFKMREFGTAPDAIVGPGTWQRLLWGCSACGGY